MLMYVIRAKKKMFNFHIIILFYFRYLLIYIYINGKKCNMFESNVFIPFHNAVMIHDGLTDRIN